MLELDKDNFETETQGGPIIVDFWASWCGPCRQLAPVFEKLAGEYEGKLRFAKLNVEQNQDLAGQNEVRGIPCLIIFNNGKELGRIVGSFPEPSLKNKIDEILETIQK